MKHFLMAAILFCLAPVLANAQDTYPRGEVYGGYSFVNASIPNFGGTNAPLGFQGDAEANVNSWFGVEGDFSYNTKSVTTYSQRNYGFGGGYGCHGYCGPSYATTVSGSLATYTGGPRFTYRNGRTSVFAHVLIGGMTLSGAYGGLGASTSAFTYGFGGGLDVSLARHLAIRAVQADYLTAAEYGVRLNMFRIGTGLVISF